MNCASNLDKLVSYVAGDTPLDHATRVGLANLIMNQADRISDLVVYLRQALDLLEKSNVRNKQVLEAVDKAVLAIMPEGVKQ